MSAESNHPLYIRAIYIIILYAFVVAQQFVRQFVQEDVQFLRMQHTLKKGILLQMLYLYNARHTLHDLGKGCFEASHVAPELALGNQNMALLHTLLQYFCSNLVLKIHF